MKKRSEEERGRRGRIQFSRGRQVGMETSPSNPRVSKENRVGDGEGEISPDPSVGLTRRRAVVFAFVSIPQGVQSISHILSGNASDLAVFWPAPLRFF